MVWPSHEGTVRGASLAPLCPSATSFPESNPEFYALLGLVDALRVGRVRERAIAEELLRARLLPTEPSR